MVTHIHQLVREDDGFLETGIPVADVDQVRDRLLDHRRAMQGLLRLLLGTEAHHSLDPRAVVPAASISWIGHPGHTSSFITLD